MAQPLQGCSHSPWLPAFPDLSGQTWYFSSLLLGSFHITQTAAATSRCFRSGRKACFGPFRVSDSIGEEMNEMPVLRENQTSPSRLCSAFLVTHRMSLTDISRRLLVCQPRWETVGTGDVGVSCPFVRVALRRLPPSEPACNWPLCPWLCRRACQRSVYLLGVPVQGAEKVLFQVIHGCCRDFPQPPHDD